jgi:hypothetical protein
VGPRDTLAAHDMLCYLAQLIVEDEGERAARTHDLEKPGVQVLLPEQEAESIAKFLEMHRQLLDQ